MVICAFWLCHVQVCTACANAFAHGSNEVANAVGPLAAIYQVWQYGEAKAKNPVPTWLLAYGGIGICVGLATCEWCHSKALVAVAWVAPALLLCSAVVVLDWCFQHHTISSTDMLMLHVGLLWRR